MSDLGLGQAEGKLVLDTSDYEKGFKKADKTADDFVKDNKKRSRDLQAVGAGLLAIGAAGAVGFGLAVKEAAAFEERLSAVKAVSGATETELESLRQKALQLGRDTAFGATEAAIAMEELVKAGLSVEDILNGAADATVALAAAGEVELAEAATIASSAMNQFGLEAQELPKVADLIAGAANASAIDVSDFGQSIQQAGAVANLAGLSFNDTALAITAMGNAGIRGSDAGTSLKTFLQNLQPTTAKQIELFQELGLAIEENATAGNELGNVFFDNEGQIRSMSEISSELNTALAGMSDAQKTMALETIFGTDAIRAAGVLAGITEEEMSDLQETLENTSATDIAAERLDNFNGKITILKGSLQTLLIEVGTPFLDLLTQVAEQATILTNAFLQLDPATRDLIVQVTGAVTAVSGLLGGLILFGRFFAPVVAGFKLIAGVVSAFAGQWAAAAAVAGGPITVIIAIIAALVAAVVLAYFHIRQVRDFIDRLIDTIVEFGETALEWFEEKVLPAVQAFADWFTDNVIPAVEEFVGIFLEVMAAVADFFTETLVPAIQDAATAIQEILSELWAWVEENVIPTVEAIVELLVAIWDRLYQYFETVLLPFWTFLWNAFIIAVEIAWAVIQPIVEGAITAISLIISTFVEAITAIWNAFGDNLVAVFAIAWNLIVGIVETFLGIIRGVAQILTGLISGDWQKFTDGIQTLWEATWNFVKTIFETIWAVIATAIEGAISGARLAWELFTAAIELAWDSLWNAVKTIFETIWATIVAVLTGAWDLIQTTWETFTGAVETAWSELWETIKAIFEEIWEDISGVAQTAWDAMELAFQTVLDAIQLAWDTLWGGFETAISAAWALVEPIINAIKTALDGLKQAADTAYSAFQRVKDLASGGLNPFGDVPGLPFLARGAILRSPLVAVVGDVPEAVIPLNDTERALELLNASGLSSLVLENASAGAQVVTTAAPTSSLAADEDDGSGAAILIDEANFFEIADIEAFLDEAEMVASERSF